MTDKGKLLYEYQHRLMDYPPAPCPISFEQLLEEIPKALEAGDLEETEVQRDIGGRLIIFVWDDEITRNNGRLAAENYMLKKLVAESKVKGKKEILSLL